MKSRPYTPRDATFTTKLDAWQPSPQGFSKAFGRDGANDLYVHERNFSADSRRIVFLTFENRYAPLGGLATVMRQLPACLYRAGEEVTVLTPLYPNIPKVGEALASGELELIVPPQEFGHLSYRGTVSCYVNRGGQFAAYFIYVDGRFTAAINPYSYIDASDILDDSLAFCAAVPFVMRELGISSDIVFHAHDWETAPIAITSKHAVFAGVLKNARTLLTLHNSFDSGIDESRKRMFFGEGVPGSTVLGCALPLLNGPLTTVSSPFASELSSDPLQRTVFTNHLQAEFSKNPPAGIENGMFGKPYLRYTYAALSRARQGVYDRILREKGAFREGLCEVVRGMAGREGVIGQCSMDNGQCSTRNVQRSMMGNEQCSMGDDADGSGGGDKSLGINPNRPIFFMSGRLDLMQKGFDVIFHAIQSFPVGKVGLIFCPSSAEGERHARELAFFREIAEARAGDIVIWPFRISDMEYESVLFGSSFLLMPSFYEPFGAATEGFIHGTPVVARATGGLKVQVRCGDGDDGAETATGLLYREAVGGGYDGYNGDDGDGWRDILNLPVEERINVPLYRSMVDEASKALSRAVEIFSDGALYGRMMVNGMDSLRGFSWDTAVEKYRRVYDVVSRRGMFDY